MKQLNLGELESIQGGATAPSQASLCGIGVGLMIGGAFLGGVGFIAGAAASALFCLRGDTAV